MFRKWLNNHFSKRNYIDNYSHRKIFLPYPHIWQLNCSSISRGMAIGLFVAFIPLPLQMLLAGFLAVLFRANLPISIVMTWVTNPFTFIPINYFVYWIGKQVLGEPVTDFTVPSFTWQFENATQFWSFLLTQVSQLGKAYFVGLPIVAVGMSALGYFIVKIAWYFSTSVTHKKRIKINKIKN